MKILQVIGDGRAASPDALGDYHMPIMLSNQLAKDGEEVTILANFTDYTSIDNSIKVVPFKSSLRSKFKDIVESAIKLYDEEGFDIVHFHASILSVVKWLSFITGDHHVVFTYHSPSLGGMVAKNAQEFAYELSNKSNTVFVAISDYMERLIRGYFTENDPMRNLIRIDNGVVYPDTINLDREDYLFSMCRMTPYKRAKEQLELIRDNDIPAIFVGQPYITSKKAEEEYVDSCIDIINSSPNITWYKEISNTEVHKILSRAKAYMNVSDMEGMSLSVLESLSEGTPVITTHSAACDANEEVMRVGGIDPNKLGYVFDYPNRARWSVRKQYMLEGWNDIVAHPRDNQFIHDYTKKYYDISVCARNHEKLYRDLVDGTYR